MSAHVPNAHAGPARVPERVGKYEVLLPIASGGMATVYLARARGHGGFEQDVALKLTHAHLRETSEFVVDLLEEAKLAARIRHRNVISILDVGDDPNGVFLVMEYVEGDSLAGVRRRATAAGLDIPIAVTARVFIDALAALHAAHELTDEHGTNLGVVHRDFSPQNVLVGLDGVVKLTDFGIAKASTRLGQTQSGLVKGKIAYMAPEQAKGGVIDRRTDVWAAGIVAWEFFSGIRLYPQGDDVSTLLKVVSEVPPRLRSVAPHVSSLVEDAVARALTMNIEQRTPSASAFAKELTVACRATGDIAEYDEVAEFMQMLVGPKIAERRKATAEIARLRARVGQLTEVTATSGATPSVDALAAARASVPGQPASTPAPLSAPPSPPSASAVPLPELEAPTIASGPSVPVMPAWVPPPSYEPPTRTDTTSVSTSHPLAPSQAPKRGAHPAVVALVSGGIALLVVLAGVGVMVMSRRSAQPSAKTAVASAPVAAAAPALSVEREPTRAVTNAAPPPTATGAAPLALKASAPIATLRVGARVIPIDRPTRELDVALQPAERESGGTLEAVATDGREARVSFSAGAVVVKVDFPAPRAPVAAAPPPPTATPPPPPAPAPRPKAAPLAPDPYAPR